MAPAKTQGELPYPPSPWDDPGGWRLLWWLERPHPALPTGSGNNRRLGFASHRELTARKRQDGHNGSQVRAVVEHRVDGIGTRLDLAFVGRDYSIKQSVGLVDPAHHHPEQLGRGIGVDTIPDTIDHSGCHKQEKPLKDNGQ